MIHRADTAIPADDPARKLTLAQPDDPNLSHIGLVGDTYTILVAGKDTQEGHPSRQGGDGRRTRGFRFSRHV